MRFHVMALLVFGVLSACTHLGYGPGESLEVTLLTPAPESRVATPLSPIVLEFSDPVGKSSVTPQSIWVVERESQRRVPVSIDADSDPFIVSLTPNRPLSPNYRYTVFVDGVVSERGHAARYSARFFTRWHFASHFVEYTSSGAFKYYDAAIRQLGTEGGDGGEIVVQVDYTYAGPDEQVETADDIPGVRSEYHYNRIGDLLDVLVRADRGPDGRYGTGDDAFLYQRHLTWGPEGLQHRYHAHAGPDGQLGTADDFDADLAVYAYDSLDRSAGQCDVATGADETAFTADDVTTSCSRKVYGAGTRSERTSVDAGGDGIWRTGDDGLAATWTLYFFGPAGETVRSEEHALAPGGNLIAPNPSDATLTGYSTYTYDHDNLLIAVRAYGAPGADGQWKTADDIGVERTAYSYRSNGLVVTRHRFTAGLDGLLDTEDDHLSEERRW